MNTFKIQEELFDRIKSQIGNSKLWVDEIAHVLSLSKPAVYKRINGSTALSLGDLAVLMKTYDFSFDSFIHTDKLTVDFSFPFNENGYNNFLEFLQPVKTFVSNLSKIPDVEIWHSTNELHLFYYFMDMDLTKFKFFLFAKSIWNIKGYENIKFSLNNFSGSSIIEKEVNEILSYYLDAPNIEIWNENILSNTLNQIKYFLISGFFEHPEEALLLCAKLRSLLKHVRKMAEEGKKFNLNQNSTSQSGQFLLFQNEISHTNHLMLIHSSSKKMVVTAYNNPNFMITENEHLFEYTKNWFLKIKKMSQPISLDAAQSRMLLFNQIEKKIDLTEKEIHYLLERLS